MPSTVLIGSFINLTQDTRKPWERQVSGVTDTLATETRKGGKLLLEALPLLLPCRSDETGMEYAQDLRRFGILNREGHELPRHLNIGY